MHDLQATIHTPSSKPRELLVASTNASPPTVRVGNHVFNDRNFFVMAGPCAVENEQQIEQAAAAVRRSGGHILRGGAFKPRTSPYSFQGLGLEGIELLRRASLRSEMPCITEVVSVRDIEAMAPRIDCFQVGARNMQNYELLKELGQTRVPVMLKRGFGATLKEWINAAEYIAKGGNDQIILCERGIRAFSQETRFTLDLAGAVWAKQQSCLPVIVDPSHATGSPSLIAPLARATMAAGLNGLMVEVHADPDVALSDADQALTPSQFADLMNALRPLAQALDLNM